MEDQDPLARTSSSSYQNTGRSDLVEYEIPKAGWQPILRFSQNNFDLISDIFDCIVGKDSSEFDSVENSDNWIGSKNLKTHIRKIAIERRREIARNILKTDNGIKIVNAIKARIAYYMVGPSLIFSLEECMLAMNSYTELWRKSVD